VRRQGVSKGKHGVERERELEWIMKAIKEPILDLVKNSDFQLTLGK
jgi:hypothetical protein